MKATRCVAHCAGWLDLRYAGSVESLTNSSDAVRPKIPFNLKSTVERPGSNLQGRLQGLAQGPDSPDAATRRFCCFYTTNLIHGRYKPRVRQRETLGLNPFLNLEPCKGDVLSEACEKSRARTPDLRGVAPASSRWGGDSGWKPQPRWVFMLRRVGITGI